MAVHLTDLRCSRVSDLEKFYTLTTDVLQSLRQLDDNVKGIETRSEAIAKVWQHDKKPNDAERADQLHNVLNVYSLAANSVNLLSNINAELDYVGGDTLSSLSRQPSDTNQNPEPSLEYIFKVVNEAAELLQKAYEHDDKFEDIIYQCRQDILFWAGNYFYEEPISLDKMFQYRTPEIGRLRNHVLLWFGEILCFEGEFVENLTTSSSEFVRCGGCEGCPKLPRVIFTMLL